MTDPDALAAFTSALGDIPVLRDPALVQQRSRDCFWYSPVLKRQLNDRVADLVVCPRNRDEVERVLAAAVRFSVSVTPRGGGTGTCGQSVPLAGGVVLDLTRLDRIVWVRDGMMRVEAGARLVELERVLRERGWELRLFPSAKRNATIGGFVAGDAVGVGSVNWGALDDPGNVLAVQIVTAEATPRVLELRGSATGLVSGAWGTTGVITELELPLAPAMPWRDVVAGFPGFMQAARFCLDLASNPAIDRKLVSAVEAAIAQSFRGVRELLSAGECLALLMVAPSGMTALRELVAAHGGRIVLDADTLVAETHAGGVPLYELAWHHTTLQMLKRDPAVTYLRSRFPVADSLATVERIRALFGDEVPMHLEFVTMGGAPACVGLQIVRFSTEERLAEIIRIHEQNGVAMSTPHACGFRGGDRVGFRQQVDPLRLLNPGKMIDEVAAVAVSVAAD
ncbi:FAD-binding oxidoreductase [Lichenicola sp.]|uniref:FAD-binding oxidoreductase n=1 Tax=Lichenicola sp. TaxID=2804529 RepID=UPI003AFFB25F